MNNRTIRELAGEIGAEILMRQRDPQHPLAKTDWQHNEAVLEVIMGVLARHTGTTIVSDEDFPVTPLPRKSFD